MNAVKLEIPSNPKLFLDKFRIYVLKFNAFFNKFLAVSLLILLFSKLTFLICFIFDKVSAKTSP